ncbi:MAG: hypothetical protein WC705_02330 [Candidatus Paceibacterota bacterium]|jgi:hypothetical protein
MKDSNKEDKEKKSTTLVELLVVMGILVFLGGAAIFVINPAEFLAESRDVKRISDVKNLEINLAKAKFSPQAVLMGSPNTVYPSIPDSSPTCDNLNLPELPLGWSYRCISQEDIFNVDGTGWVPVDFTKLAGSISINILPTDPVNDVASESYYLYSVDDSNNFYVAANNLESNEYTLGGDKDKTSTDDGDDDYSYEEKSDDFKDDISGNIVDNTNINHISESYNPGWDVNLNGDHKPSRGFSFGYNPSVPSPSVGYHGHVFDPCGIGNSPCIEFIDKNTQYGYPHRLQEIYQTWQNLGLTHSWKPGTAVRVKFMAKVDNKNKTARFGIYHWSNSQGAYVFDTAIVSKTIPNKKDWEKITHEFTVTSDWEVDNHDASLYLFGNDGEEGTLWVDNVQLEYFN